VLVAVERLLVKLRQPPSRAGELLALRRRLRDERAQMALVSGEERALAEAARAKKLSVSAALHGVASCSSCADGQPSPVGEYAGGACCSGITEHIFDDAELAALAHAGTRASDLHPPPRTEHHAGCAFRGARGCTLAAAHRPARCIHYVCDTLRRELYDRGDLDAIESDLAELRAMMERIAILRRARADRAVLAPLLEALEQARTR
jgi:hypothetical protein